MKNILTPLHLLNFEKAISPDDWMCKGQSSFWYFVRGYQALELIHPYIQKPDGAILDFGCGHGCVVRMIKAQFPKARVVGQDVNQEWLDWCTENLGIETIKSAEHVSDVSVAPESYDFIWVGSVFTHIPEGSFRRLLAALIGGLKKGGSLVFTTAGWKVRAGFVPGKERLISHEGAIETLAGYDSVGFGFTSYENGVYPDWGRTLCTFEYVQQQLNKFNVRLVSFKEGGWGNRQDVYVVTKL